MSVEIGGFRCHGGDRLSNLTLRWLQVQPISLPFLKPRECSSATVVSQHMQCQVSQQLRWPFCEADCANPTVLHDSRPTPQLFCVKFLTR